MLGTCRPTNGCSKVAFYDLEVGVTIGTNQAGAATSTLRVLVDNVTGKAITAYPK